jgi:Phosphopantetheine attachment site.
MESKILEIFRSVFNEEDPSSITLETEFRDLAQFTSLTQVVLIDAIQKSTQH